MAPPNKKNLHGKPSAAPSPRAAAALAVHDGTAFVGTVVERGDRHFAFGVTGKMIGSYQSQIAAKLWRKAIRQCPQSLFELGLMPDGGRSDDATRRYVHLFAKLTGLDQPATAHRWLSSRGLDFLQGFGIDLRCPDCPGACTSNERPDCLHCRLWEIIHRQHPSADDVIIAVADVIGDYLNNKHARPLQDQLWQQTRERIVTRMRDGRKERHRE